jgi:hypothetical protein
MPTTSEMANSAYFSAATLAGIVRRGKSGLDQDRLYHKMVPCPLIPDAANIVYPYDSTDVFQDESQDMVPIKQQTSIYNRSWHCCPSSCLPLYFVAAL